MKGMLPSHVTSTVVTKNAIATVIPITGNTVASEQAIEDKKEHLNHL